MNNNMFAPAVYQSFEEKSDPSLVGPRIAALQAELAREGLDAFLVPRADAHRGESVPPGQARLAYITGFTGSAGIAVIGKDRAGLFVDSRYTLQAPQQTDTELVEVVEAAQGGLSTRIGDFVTAGGKIGYDPWLHTPSEIRDLAQKLQGNAEMVPVDNLVDRIWSDRPGAPDAPIQLRSDNLAGRSMQAKVFDLLADLRTEQADGVVLTMPESICWLFNIRGNDVPNTPFVLGFAVIDSDGKSALFVDESKLTPDRLSMLQPIAEYLRPVSEFAAALKRLGTAKKRVLVDPATAPMAVADALEKAGAILVEKRDPVLLPKSRKNEAEIAGMREAHRLDGAAVTRFLAWFDAEAPKGELTEIDIVTALESFRRRDPSNLDASFDTIAGAGPNGAIVHYRVTRKTNRKLSPGELMLVDSGAQYLSGTTDITRTLFTGSASPEHKDRFTRVLKGMIGISMARFPKGTSGAQIDVLARQHLWQAGLTYSHGTGHGVGAYLSVHEGPIGISPRYPLPLEPGMIVSNEPGYYKEGEYGIRIENLVLVRESEVGGGGFLEFETLTLAPIELRLVEPVLLTESEREWLNTYHARVWTEIGPLLEEPEREWLKEATKAI